MIYNCIQVIYSNNCDWFFIFILAKSIYHYLQIVYHPLQLYHRLQVIYVFYYLRSTNNYTLTRRTAYNKLRYKMLATIEFSPLTGFDIFRKKEVWSFLQIIQIKVKTHFAQKKFYVSFKDLQQNCEKFSFHQQRLQSSLFRFDFFNDFRPETFNKLVKMFGVEISPLLFLNLPFEEKKWCNLLRILKSFKLVSITT